jgi:hypothetical protein
MTNQFKVAVWTALAGGVAWFAPMAKANEWDERTVLTFNEPVEIPGQVLRREPTFSSWPRRLIEVSSRFSRRIRRTSLQQSWGYRITAWSQQTRL